MNGFGENFLEKPVEQQTTETVVDTKSTDTTAQTQATTETTSTEQTTATTETTVVEQPQITEDQILAWAKTKNESINSIDDIFATKEVEKIVEKQVNPWEGVIDEETEQYLSFRKETGRGRDEFNFIKKDIDALPALDLAIEKARRDSGMSLTKEQAYAYLEKRLNIDLGDPSALDISDEVELNSYVKPFRDDMKAQKEQYLKPIERPANTNTAFDAEKYVALEDGSFVPKEAIEKNKALQEQQYNQFLQENKASVDAVVDAKFTMVIDDNGSQKELSVDYKYSDEDRQDMLSITNDVSKVMEERYRDPATGKFNNAKFNEDLLWTSDKFRSKAIASMLHQQRAEIYEALHRSDNNVDFTRQAMPGKKTNAAVPMTSSTYGFGAGFIPNTNTKN